MSSVSSVNQAIGSAILSQLESDTSETDLQEITREVKSSSKTMTANQIAEKYDITIAEAKQILKDIETENEAKEAKQVVEVPRRVAPDEGSSVTYEA